MKEEVDIKNDKYLQYRLLFNTKFKFSKKEYAIFIDEMLKEKEKQDIHKMQDIVKKYFDNILHLPCPDFRENFKENL